MLLLSLLLSFNCKAIIENETLLFKTLIAKLLYESRY